MRGSLFRKEALETKTKDVVSRTIMVAPLSFSVFSSFVLLVAASIIAFVLVGRYAPKDTVRGYVATTHGGVEVYSHSDGTILEVLVTEGDSVLKDQDLLRVNTSRAVGQSAATRRQIVSALRSERADLKEQTLRENEAFRIRVQVTEGEVLSLRARVRLLNDQRNDLTAGLHLSEQALQRHTKLDASEFSSQQDIDQARATVVEQRLRLRDLELTVANAQAEIRQKQLKLGELPVLRERRNAELRIADHQLSNKLTESMGRDTQRVLAPSSGIVSGLLVRESQTISANSPLLNIVPDNVEFYVELLVPTRTIAFVRPGAPVNIRYDAYPYQKFGTYKGTIENVSRTTVLPADKRFRIAVAEPMYVARVKIQDQGILTYGELQSLQSGMTLTADVLRDERRLIDWLFEPLIGAMQRL